MRHIDFTPFYRSTVGFDRLFDLLGSGSGFEVEANTYPPTTSNGSARTTTALPWRWRASARTS